MFKVALPDRLVHSLVH